MGNRPLGRKWLRRIARTTGLEVVHGSGSGGYWHSFTTADHRHGVIHAVTLDWRLLPPAEVWHGASCRRLFPEEDQRAVGNW